MNDLLTRFERMIDLVNQTGIGDWLTNEQHEEVIDVWNEITKLLTHLKQEEPNEN